MRVSRGMLRSRCWDGAERAAAELGGGGEAALGGTPALCCGAQRLSGCGQEPLAAADKIPQEGPARPPAPALSLQPGVRPCAREAARSRVLALGLSRPSSPCRQDGRGRSPPQKRENVSGILPSPTQDLEHPRPSREVSQSWLPTLAEARLPLGFAPLGRAVRL
ncbi:uncharacterized protein LOC142419499 isoform X2 [Mycteria americana]|uniref:uncharacterized protein LOC142419499 isoform X2 n=1 Tax=Mycteria americana TaxID=33587 RepID=UPI003F589D27